MSKTPRFLPRADLQNFIDTLQNEGYEVIGPQVKDHAVIYAPLKKVEQLPQGITDEQEAGRYRLHSTKKNRYFNWVNGPQTIKPFLFAPRQILWSVKRNEEGRLSFEEHKVETKKRAILGVRACDIAALELHDKHFLQNIIDPYYQNARKQLLLVGINCTKSASTCFCVSTGDGPEINRGVDILLGEVDAGFLVSAKSDAGNHVVAQLKLQEADKGKLKEVEVGIASAAQQQRQLNADLAHTQLFNRLNHARWDEVAERCLSCGNCTSVCPTCFCHSEEDNAVLDGQSSQHIRQWDSCFSQGHSYIHGYVFRPETKYRYRQWLTHKLSSWYEQYGRSGCVGCGRCIAWCPVGIDITEEVAAICGEASGA